MGLKKGTLTKGGIATAYTIMIDVKARLLDNCAIEQNRPYDLVTATEVLNQMICLNKEFANTTARALQMQMNIFTSGIVGKTIDKASNKKGWRNSTESLKDIELRKQFILSIK